MAGILGGRYRAPVTLGTSLPQRSGLPVEGGTKDDVVRVQRPSFPSARQVPVCVAASESLAGRYRSESWPWPRLTSTRNSRTRFSSRSAAGLS